MSLLDEIHKKRKEILKLAAECGLADVRVFGSVARGEDDEKSDIDVLIKSTYEGDPLGFLDFKRALEGMTGRKVDVVFESGLYHGLKEKILGEARPI